MSLIILKRESRANGELFCMKLPYKNSVPTRSLSYGWGRVFIVSRLSLTGYR